MKINCVMPFVISLLIPQIALAEVDCAVKAGLYIRAMANKQFATNSKDHLVPFRIEKSAASDADAYYKTQKLNPDQLQKAKTTEMVYAVTANSADGFKCTFYAMADRVKLESKKDCVINQYKFEQCVKPGAK